MDKDVFIPEQAFKLENKGAYSQGIKNLTMIVIFRINKITA
jgi:hypothetical protein